MRLRKLLPAMLLTFSSPFAASQDRSGAGQESAVAAAALADVPEIKYQSERLKNGLSVIYAPMDNAPVVHVRLLYHVGSRDETPQRQGLAHMFEHMMFRGSEHVPSERHMELINGVGGNSNAFTGFDQTTFVNTIPASALEMALWLEADRMGGGFKVDAEKFTTERNVVNEEYLQRVVNPPYGRMMCDFFELAYEASHYRWTPIGDMEHLRAAEPPELQAFFDTYYVPNNAVLVIAGSLMWRMQRDGSGATWPGFPRVMRSVGSARANPHSKMRRKIVQAPAIPLSRVTLGYKTTTYADADQEVLEVLAAILGQGRSSRLYQPLVGGPDPIASQVSAGNQRMEDTGMFLISVGLLQDGDPDEAERRVLEVVARVAAEGVTAGQGAHPASPEPVGSAANGEQRCDGPGGGGGVRRRCRAGEQAGPAPFEDHVGRRAAHHKAISGREASQRAAVSARRRAGGEAAS